MFDRIIQGLDNFPTLIDAAFQKAIEANGEVLKNFIVERQLYEQGVDGNNKKLRAYKRITIRLKTAKRQPVNRTTLRDEGHFHNSVEIVLAEGGFKVHSNVSYDKYLLDPAESYYAYGFDILKPSTENVREFFDNYVVPELLKLLESDRK